MRLTSPVFEHDGMIPKEYGRDFRNVNPPLRIEDIPVNAISLVLTMEDPDVPEAAGVPVWDHWIVFNIPATTTVIPESWSPGGVRGKGTRGELEYGGPRPPDREHRYVFTVYALHRDLNLPEGAAKKEVLDAMKDHIIEMHTLIGRYAPQS